MAASRHTSPPLAILAVAFTVLGFILIYTFSQIYGNLLADQVTDFVAARLGMSAARMTAQFAPIVVPGGLAAMCLWAAFLVAVWYVRHTELPQGQMSPQELSLKEREVAAAEANADALQRQARQLEWQHDPWLQAIRESGSRVSLSLVWRRNGLQLCVHNDGPDAVFEANVDLSDAGVQSDRRGKYAAVWADDPDADRKKIFEGADEYIALY